VKLIPWLACHFGAYDYTPTSYQRKFWIFWHDPYIQVQTSIPYIFRSIDFQAKMENHKRVKKVGVYEHKVPVNFFFQQFFFLFLIGKLENFFSSVTINHLIFWKITPNFWYHKIAPKKKKPLNTTPAKNPVFFFFKPKKKCFFLCF